MRLLSNNRIRHVLLLYKRAGIKTVVSQAAGKFYRKTGFKKYKSCVYIESGLSFFNDNVRFCCISNSYTHSVISDYNSIDKLDANKIRDLRKALRKTPYTECEQCTLFTKSTWRTNQKFKIINLLHGDICNFRCQYCYQTAPDDYTPKKASHKITPYLRYLYESKLISDNAFFAFGGEPTLHPEFMDYLTFIKGLKRGYATITTNASVYVEEIEELLASEKCEILCSVDSGSHEVFNRVKGADSFHKVIGNLKKYASAGRVIGKYIIFEGNCDPDEIIKFVKIMREINAASVRFTFDYRSKNDDLPDNHIMCAAVGRIWAELMQLDVTVDVSVFKYSKQIKNRLRNFYKQINKTQKELFLKHNK